MGRKADRHEPSGTILRRRLLYEERRPRPAKSGSTASFLAFSLEISMRTTSINTTTAAARAASPLPAAPEQRAGSLTDQQKKEIVQRASEWLADDFEKRKPIFQAIIEAVDAGENAVVVARKPLGLPEFDGFTVIEGDDVEHSKLRLSNFQRELQAIGGAIDEFESHQPAAAANAGAVLAQHAAKAARKSEDRSTLDLTGLDENTKHLIVMRQKHAQILASMQKDHIFLTMAQSLRSSGLL